MLGFLKKLTQKQLSFEQLKILQLVTQQVVLSVEGSIKLPGSDKKAVALELAAQILQEMGVVAPDSLVDAMIESSVQILKVIDKSKESKPKYSFDMSGKPKTGSGS